MIRLLSIRQLAVVEHLEIEFEDGLNVLTGETGAGKSILIDAVALLLGERASVDLVRRGADAAVVQAEVEAGGTSIIVRREISAQGRSRSFIDDNLVTTAGLRTALADAIQLHGQHEHQRLFSPVAQLELLDSYAECRPERDRTASAYSAWRAAAEVLESIERELEDRAGRLEQARFELAEIDRVAPKANEDAEREADRLVLAHADKLFRLSQEAYSSLYEEDDAVIPRLRTVFRRVGELAGIDPRFAEVAEQQQGLEAQLGEIARFLRAYLSNLDTGGEHDAETEGVIGAIALVDDDLPLGPILLGQEREIEARRSAADNRDPHTIFPTFGSAQHQLSNM
jgi:DNA repair protein RecN (Recombination protein N)